MLLPEAVRAGVHPQRKLCEERGGVRAMVGSPEPGAGRALQVAIAMVHGACARVPVPRHGHVALRGRPDAHFDKDTIRDVKCR